MLRNDRSRICANSFCSAGRAEVSWWSCTLHMIGCTDPRVWAASGRLFLAPPALGSFSNTWLLFDSVVRPVGYACRPHFSISRCIQRMTASTLQHGGTGKPRSSPPNDSGSASADRPGAKDVPTRSPTAISQPQGLHMGRILTPFL